MKDVIVTGASGFVGRHLVRALAARGCVVRGIGHGSWQPDEWRRWGLTEWHDADITIESLAVFDAPDALFHCAGSGSVGFSLTQPYKDFSRTVLSTISLLEFARVKAPKAKLVLPSSAAVYGIAPVMPIPVSAPLKPLSVYGLHKKMAEDLCRSYGRNFGVQSAIVRLFSIYGIGMRKQLLWDACQKLAIGNSAFAGTGLETRDWLHISDAAELLMLAAAYAAEECPVVNGGTGHPACVRDVVNRIAAGLAPAASPTFSGEVRAGDPTHFAADISEALAWGWSPSKDLHKELDNFVTWYKSESP